MIDQIGELLRSLVKVGDATMAEMLQSEMTLLLKLCQDASAEVWSNSAKTDCGTGYRYGPDATTSTIVGEISQPAASYTPPMHLLGK